ncbi:hypothetical protein BREVUG8_40220 [Brevundimonas sp. G8]|nr:hypothetical protein BREVUG8_40220 [Brevundimonas sp. G8]
MRAEHSPGFGPGFGMFGLSRVRDAAYADAPPKRQSGFENEQETAGRNRLRRRSGRHGGRLCGPEGAVGPSRRGAVR